jgi:hypothetical protein
MVFLTKDYTVKKFVFLLCVGILVACGAPSKPASSSTDTTAATPATQVLPPHMADIKGERLMEMFRSV